jgi:hypothetical protein
MKKLVLVFFIALALDAGDDNPTTGQSYQAESETLRRAYVHGYLEGYIRGRNFAMNEYTRLLLATTSESTRKSVVAEMQAAKDKVIENWGAICLPRDGNPTVGQMTAILDKYIADHPEKWDKPVRELAEEAFIEACEKRAKNP